MVDQLLGEASESSHKVKAVESVHVR